MDRNKLSENEALQRIQSQMTNQQRVDQANVVLSTLWQPEVTQTQVRINNNNIVDSMLLLLLFIEDLI